MRYVSICMKIVLNYIKYIELVLKYLHRYMAKPVRRYLSYLDTEIHGIDT